MQSTFVAYSAPDTAVRHQSAVPLVLAVTLTWFAIAGELIWLDWAQTAVTLGDSDDAMRLVEVRELLAGRGWFDLHEPRLQPPIGYDTHWSRLIDGGLAGLFLLFEKFTDAALAERLMRAVWPLLWVLPAIVGTISIAWRLGGRTAAYIILLMLLFGLPALIQFRVGRIDHHDVQITLALLAVAAAIWADSSRWTPWAAGALSALALAIGFESMAFIVVAGGIFALRFIDDRNSAPALARYGQSLAVTTAIVFFAGTGPDHWMQTACDAMAVNVALPTFVAGLALAVIAPRYAGARPTVRFALVLYIAALTAAIFVLLEPRCIRGPLAMVDPAVKPIWLAHVIEARSLLSMIAESPVTGFGIAAYPVLAVLCMLALACSPRLRRDSGFIAAAVALVVAVSMVMIAIRASPYTFWFGMPFVAAALAHLFGLLPRLASTPVRAIAAILFAPVFISWGTIAIVEAIVAPKTDNRSEADEACFRIENFAPLAKLPTGLIVADVDFGSFVLALTPHSAIAAPYHRMSYGIVTSHRAFAAPPDEAREILRSAQANYVMICGSRGPRDLNDADMQQSLWTQLTNGKIPDWLEPMPSESPLAVFRIKP